ncbi:MAG: 2Fe-2S iron-sulfur cluster binding domain-containing protein [Sphingobacteriales bacterium]|nr:MAG: 2Fe-2S iron-sulfur cluster binding domain-containing protein [Sphingobacteriales bacterium]
MFKVTIDGVETEVEPGTTILNAARKIGGEVAPPAMCYYSKLKGSGGKCRACLVKVTKGSEKDPRPMPKLVASCVTTVMDGMEVVNYTNDEVMEARRGVVEFLLLNHPLDCPICDQAGECHLQDFGFEHGRAKTRYEEGRRIFNLIDIGPYIKLHMTRCILCYRCTMVADQLTPERVHGVLWRGDVSEISTYIEKAIDNEFSGNMIDVCPVGALTDNTFRFKSRVWFLKPFNAHRNCPKCSGKVVVWNHGNEIYRVTGRKDEWGELEEFICNECRYDKKEVTDWTIEGPRIINRHSVISHNMYEAPYGNLLRPGSRSLPPKKDFLTQASAEEK